MIAKSTAVALSLCCAACAFAAEPASDAASAPGTPPSLDNSHCDAYRYAVTSVRSPKDLGLVVLRFEVSREGQVVGSEVVEQTTSRYFAHVVQESFSKCHFNPARQNGVAVQGHQVVRLIFGDPPNTPNAAVCPPPFSRERPPSSGPMVATKLRIRFNTTGRVASVDVLQGSGVAALDDAAVKAYLQCHFDPEAANQPAFREEWIMTVNWSS